MKKGFKLSKFVTVVLVLLFATIVAGIALLNNRSKVKASDVFVTYKVTGETSVALHKRGVTEVAVSPSGAVNNFKLEYVGDSSGVTKPETLEMYVNGKAVCTFRKGIDKGWQDCNVGTVLLTDKVTVKLYYTGTQAGTGQFRLMAFDNGALIDSSLLVVPLTVTSASAK